MLLWVSSASLYLVAISYNKVAMRRFVFFAKKKKIVILKRDRELVGAACTAADDSYASKDSLMKAHCSSGGGAMGK